MSITTADLKHAARVLRAELAEAGLDLAHGRALELVAHQVGCADWNTAAAAFAPTPSPPMPPASSAGHGSAAGLGAPVPVLRMFDVERTREFYLGFLGFSVVFEHRFEPELPLYLRVERDGVRLDLSEHHGDGTPGSVVWVPVADVRAYRRELLATGYPRMRPGIDDDAPGGPTMEVVDPAQNVLRFAQRSGE
ncbi:glyoxalase superfamily protein [Myceligenerans pegani]|uniref:Bleomycin resistance protein n=1 Tax=Myceligenerans pegani TaxID=2776917 RepID=A0ABR9N3Y2_9MICO|nr:glyoxalase superfamily protein [Myceligenerans sp. TRM 65318]MBE1878374.1 bleomycin resistance family protein [Myceligenerans sp. TRM 65318]MBE3020645.1 bleomycin resistance family protein [Myceligenerans sp. TRM 65318]